MCHPKGRSAAKDARSALTRRPARSYSAPTIPATVRHARRRSGELPAPLADPPIAPQPTHTRLRRALVFSLPGDPLLKVAGVIVASPRDPVSSQQTGFVLAVDIVHAVSLIDANR